MTNIMNDWDNLITKLPGTHLFQGIDWAQFKGKYGWESHPITLKIGERVSSAAMVLSRKVRASRLGPEIRIAYVPRGPITDWTDLDEVECILKELEDFCCSWKAIFLKIDPEVVISIGDADVSDSNKDQNSNRIVDLLKKRGWRFSPDQVQFKNTVWLDLTDTEESLLAGMKQKTRYNIRLAEKKGVRVRIGNETDFERMFQIYAETSLRDGFAIRSKDYYFQLWKMFFANGVAYPMIAEFEGQIIAGLFIFIFAGRAWYLYGMSTNLHRDKMPNYLLQWEAIRLAKSKGVTIYDLWGAPDQLSKEDHMWGVYRFKEGLGGKLVRTIGAWDFTERPFLYSVYTQILPRILDFMRKRGRAKTQEEAGL
jgi:peptidoglycan pentaglycine glycine transferase (the first glycine)